MCAAGPQLKQTELTAVERRIVALLCDGKTNAQAGRELKLSPRTVETYRQRLMLKLGITHFSGLVKYAIRHGLTTLS